MGSTSAIWDLSERGSSSSMFVIAAGGGFLAAALATARAYPDTMPRGESWIFFRILTTFASSGIWLYILHDVSKSPELNARCITFFLGVVAYTLTKDLLQTGFSAYLSNRIAQQKENLRIARSKRAMEMAEQSRQA